MKLRESDVQRACIELLRYHGWIVRPAPRDGRKASRGAWSIPKGEPDLICVKRSPLGWHVLLIECKSPKGKLSDDQVAWIRDTGLPVHVVRSVDDVRELVDGFASAGKQRQVVACHAQDSPYGSESV